MAFFKNIFISTFLTFSFLTVQASAESRFMLNDAMIPTGIGHCEDGVCEVVYGTPEKRPSPQPFPETFPYEGEHHPIEICPDGSIGHDCSHIGPKTGGVSPPPPEEIFPEVFPEPFPKTGGASPPPPPPYKLEYPLEALPLSPNEEIFCTGVYREDGSDNCRIISTEPPILIKCAQGYISYDNKTCVPTEMTPCAISGACTSGPAGGGIGVSEPALPAMLLTLLGLGFWVRRRK